MILVYALAVLGAWTLVCTVGLIVIFGREAYLADREYRQHIKALREHAAADAIPTR